MLLRRRGGGRGLTSRWPLVPASDVPDSLINQAMAVLQGKSREAVIRELQRTNLDVNQAVNNLLSRDDDDGGDGEGSEGDPLIPAAFFPSGDELLSLLGSVGAVGPGEEDMEEGAGPGRPVRESGPRGDEGMREEIAGRLSRAVLDELGGEPLVLPGEAVGARGEGGSGGRERREEGKKRKVGGGGKSTKKDTLPTPVFFEAESPLVLGGAAPPFTHITSLHSELVAVDTEGALWRWAWKSAILESHPLVSELGLVGESVRLLSGKQLRVSVVTDSGKLASWLDWSVSPVAKLVEHSAFTPSELAGDTVVQLVSSHLFSAVLTASHKIYWWGLLPFPERKQAVVDVQERLRGSGRFSGGSSEGGEVQLDSLVCLRSSPIYTAGTKAIYCRGHRLQCGILQESVFSCSMSEKCRFRVVTARDEPVETEPSEGSKRTGEEGGAPPTPHLGVKRRYHDDGAGGREEQWSLHDVIFTDRVQSVRVGRVVKIDGLFAAVHFPGRREGVRREGGEGEEKMEEGEEGGVLGRCRLLRKDDLVLATESLTRKVPHYRQDNLARLRSPVPSDTPLVVCCGSQGVHALFSSRHQLFHVNFSLSGRVTQSSPFSQLSSHYFLHQATPTQLLPIATNQWLIRDKLGGVHLTSVNAASAMKDPLPLNLPPVTAMATGQCSSRTGVVVVAWQQQRLIPVLLRKDVSGLKTILSSTSKDDMQSLLLEHTSGGCNILHVLSLLGRPPTPSRSSSAFTSGAVGERRRGMAARTTPRSGVLREIMKQAMALASSSVSSHSLDSSEAGPWGSDEGESDSSSPPPPPLSSSMSAPSVVSLCLGQLGLVLTEPPSPLSSLLTERNVEGYTPFMAAVSYKAYQVAMQLLDLALSIADGDQNKLMAALYPSDCHPDDNPIFVLCRNDNCSFTWTGEMHIHQDIFVCRSCGLTDSLCCCTECAYTCHRGHDCVFKKASPTAYCDCWERCNCRCLAQTPDSTRLALLQKLMSNTTLANKFDGSHQSLLAALLTMASHQSRAQSHWSMIRSSSLHSRSRHEDMPVYNLRPPKFAPKALAAVVEDWQCVKSAVLCTSVGGASSIDHTHHLGSVPVDSMVYLLLAKQAGQGTLSSILSTIVKHITRGSPQERAEAVGVASCFLRSVVRVWSVCELESSNIPSPVPSSRPRPSVSKSGVGERAFFIFSSLALHAVPALLETALQVITPVTRGMARPIDPLSMTDRHKVAEEMFRLPPVSLLREQPMELSEQGGEGVSGDESEAGDGEESVAGVGGQDASSTATIGSNLLYLSDEQDSTDNDDVESDASLPAEHYHDDEDVVLEPPSQRLRLLGRRGGHWALPSAPPTSTTPSSSTSRFSRSSRRAGRSVGTSASLLAQTFSLIIRQIAVVLETTFDIRELPVPSFQLSVSHGDSDMLTLQVWARLEPVLVWLATNMDSVEVLVRRGNNISERAPFRNILSSGHGRGKAGEGGAGSDALEGRRETFSYLLTILREAGPETSGLIPAIDVAGMEHLAWTLDALHYLLETTRPSCEATPTSKDGVARTSLFFRRSRSTSCLGSLPASPFDPLHEALPLAEKPHLLDASYNKQHLFGFDKSSVLEVWPSCDLQAPPILSLISHPLPRGQGSTAPRKQTDPAHLRGCRVVGVNSHELAASVLLGRWATTVDLFGRVFGETVGRLPDSFLAQERGFKSREREFRRDMDTLHSSTHNELSLQVERPRDKLLLGVLQQLQAMCDSRHSSSPSTSLPPLCVYRFKVRVW
ncbi:E3 ubiquitin-protein ligase UBR5 [Geodia barretti]|uniref:E3 ubiquitin-protein ligase UBR5 n=1 Tax=Geodia barretti TaxID=519541 RepID=A0AA35S6X1_GEOBA|nr:E3 ubiquitin-protein ligase UBR5 [Geodia barretti]